MLKYQPYATRDIRWRRKLIKKLQKKFVLLTTIISFVVLLIIVALINVVNYTSIINKSDSLLEMLIENDLKLVETSRPPDRFPREVAFTTRFFVLRSDEDGNINYIDTKNIGSVSPEDAMVYAQDIDGNNLTVGTIDDFRFLKTETLYGYTYIFLDIEEEVFGFNQYLLFSVLIMIGAIIFIFVLSCLFSKWAVKPIAVVYEKQKRFITDVNHEFKTPLSIIKSNCDVVEMYNGEDEWIDGIKMQTDRLNLLVENLISLTKLDEVKMQGVKTDFSLNEALVETIDEFSATFQQNNIEVQKNISNNISLCATEGDIRKLFSILIENAIKYSPQNGVVSIDLLQKNGKRILIVKNECENMPIGKHDNWFDRFYREDESRNDETSGFGIGLSIAKSICESNGAKISAESKSYNEIEITVIF